MKRNRKKLDRLWIGLLAGIVVFCAMVAVFFWQNDCPRCIAEASRLQAVLNRYGNLSCHGIAVNIGNDVQQPENRILAYDPLCVNVSIANMPACETVFFATGYPKIIVTDNAGNIIALFASTASLENFLKNART